MSWPTPSTRSTRSTAGPGNRAVATTLTQLSLDAETKVATLSGGLKARCHRPRAGGLARSAAARRANQPSGPRGDCLAGGSPAQFQGQRGDHQPRPRLSRQRGHPHHRAGSRQAHHLPGNYAAYETQKAAQLEFEATVNAKFDKLLAQEEVWIRKGAWRRGAPATRARAAAGGAAPDAAARRETLGRVKLEITSGAQSGAGDRRADRRRQSLRRQR